MRALVEWVHSHQLRSLVVGVIVLFGASLVGGYWIAARLESLDQDRTAREVLQDMKRAPGVPSASQSQTTPEPKYASIDQIPGLPRYTELEPGTKVPTHEERVRARPQLAAASPQSTWRRNAVPFADISSKPLVAIVIDDVGIDRPRSRRAWELPGPLTLSFLPYAKDLREQARAAHAKGHELMLHMPMEPAGSADPGPGALLVSLGDREIKERTNTALDSFDGYIGINNHMGSRFTANKADMEVVLTIIKSRGLMFLDSRTTPQTVGDQVAQELGVPSMSRNVFLDDDESIGAVRKKLAETEEVARRQGFAVAIGHPHEATIQALAEWLPTLSAKGMMQAPASAALRRRNGWD